MEGQKTEICKTIKAICLGVGLLYSVIPMFMLLTFLLQSLPAMIDGTFAGRWNVMGLIKYVYVIFLPMIILLGIAYIKFGASFPASLKNQVLTNKTLRIISAIISAGYTIFTFITLYHSISGVFSIIKIVSFAFGFIFVILVMNIPQFILSKNIAKYLIQ